MFELIVEDIFTVTGAGTFFVGKVLSGSVSVGDRILCKTRSSEIPTRVIRLEETPSKRSLDRADAGASVVVLFATIKESVLQDAYEGQGDDRRIAGVTLVTAPRKKWWQF